MNLCSKKHIQKCIWFPKHMSQNVFDVLIHIFQIQKCIWLPRNIYLDMCLDSRTYIQKCILQDDLPRNKSNDCKWCTGLHSEIGHEQLANKSPKFRDHNLRPKFQDHNLRPKISEPQFEGTNFRTKIVRECTHTVNFFL